MTENYCERVSALVNRREEVTSDKKGPDVSQCMQTLQVEKIASFCLITLWAEFLEYWKVAS
jgi:hypothetical protein